MPKPDRATLSLSLIARRLEAQARLAEPVHVEDAEQEEGEDDIAVVYIFPEDQP